MVVDGSCSVEIGVRIAVRWFCIAGFGDSKMRTVLGESGTGDGTGEGAGTRCGVRLG